MTDEEFTDVVRKSRTVREALVKMGVAPKGGNYGAFYRRVEKLGLDISHIKSNKHKKILRDSSRVTKMQLLKNVSYSCSICGLSDWLSKPITLEMDHIDGNSTNNTIENLRLLCPNCHSQTPTFRGKNKGRASPINRCECGVLIWRTSRQCGDCNAKTREKITWPPVEQLLQMVGEFGVTETGRLLGVSGNSVSKRLRKTLPDYQ